MDRPAFEIIRDPVAMRARAEDLRRDGRRLAVVPTMGALHEGHLALIHAARARADIVIFTLFVNPTQFGPNEDLSRYPRDEAGDLDKARGAGADLAFCPDVSTMYLPGAQTYVEVRELQKPMCGASRPGHFAGVSTIVAKLFHITQPHLAVFGEKDFQQLALIRRMTRDLDFGIEIHSVPIVREADGVAMSSRNAYLDPAQRLAARALSAALAAGARGLRGGRAARARDRRRSARGARGRAARAHRLHRAPRRRRADRARHARAPRPCSRSPRSSGRRG